MVYLRWKKLFFITDTIIMVSIIIRTYNRKDYLIQALNSVKQQTFRDYEIIVVDDGSTDGTIDLIESISEIKLIKQNRGGYIKALNRGIQEASGEHIAILDDDDLWSNAFLDRCLSVFNEHPDTFVVCCDYRYFYDDNIDKLFMAENKHRTDDVLGSLIRANFIPIDSALIRKKSFEHVGMFDEELTSHDDWDMWLRMAIAGFKFKFIPEPLVKIRKHGHGMTADKHNMFAGALCVLEKYKESMPSQYNKKMQLSLDRLSNILAVIIISEGKRSEGVKLLLKSINRGSYRGILYLFAASLFPDVAINKFIKLYSKLLLKKS